MGIEVRNIRKNFGGFVAINDVNLKVNDGELVALLGPSGSGKTTLLRIIAGLEYADSGQVLIDDREAGSLHVKERNVGFVFQHYALFKHMTVFDNVAFGLRVRPKPLRPPPSEITDRVMALLKLVHLDSFYDRYPSQLSGGQRQRGAAVEIIEPAGFILDDGRIRRVHMDYIDLVINRAPCGLDGTQRGISWRAAYFAGAAGRNFGLEIYFQAR